MATTNSADKKLNQSVIEGALIEENSGISVLTEVNSGNEKVDFKKLTFNNTYSLSTTGFKAQANVKLLNYNDALIFKGSEIDGSLDADKDYQVFGHPNKFIYDYAQAYNNCGVDSCLNVLSQAGKKDIIQITQEYEEWLNTPEIITQNVIVWDEEQGRYVEEVRETKVYPKAPNLTEDEFLLWTIQNSKNDKDWLLGKYDPKYDTEEYANTYDSYVIHAKNFAEYQKIQDMKDHPGEVGGTYTWQRENILEAFGVEAETTDQKVNLRYKINSGSKSFTVKDSETYKETITISWSEDLREITTETVKESFALGKDEKLVPVETITITETEHVPNTVCNSGLVEKFCEYIDNGQGVVLSGFANAFLGKEGGNHAITLVGYVKDDDFLSKETTTKIENYTDGQVSSSNEFLETQKTTEIVGFYVLDTGGFLGNDECPQYVSTELLVDFLTDTTLIESSSLNFENYKLVVNYEQKQITSHVLYTLENIKAWSDKLNLSGNDRKNVLYGNDSENTIKGDSGNDVLYGEGGNDKIYGGNDNDVIFGDKGDDILSGDKGNDTYVFTYNDEEQHDTIVLNSGTDTIEFAHYNMSDAEFSDDNIAFHNSDGDLLINYKMKNSSGNSFNNTIKVQDYFDKNLYSKLSNIKFTYNDSPNIAIMYSQVLNQELNIITDIFNKTPIQYDINSNIVNKIKGTKFNDLITGGNYNDTISSANGNDIVDGGAGDDVIELGKHNDTVYGSYGDDKIYMQDGNNAIIYENVYSGYDTIYGSAKGKDFIQLKGKTRNDITYLKNGNDLVILYDSNKKDDSITISKYFSKKGKTSIKYIQLEDGYIDLVWDYNEILSNALQGSKINHSKSSTEVNFEGTIGYDTLTGSKYDDVISGLQGQDTLNGGSGNDTLIGGVGNDKLYGQGGENTYEFNKNDGSDTIYFTSKTKSIIDLSAVGEVDENGIVGSLNNGYSYTKSKNDLVIEYGDAIENKDKNTITISNYFKTTGDFEIVGANGTKENLRESIVYFEGNSEEKNKITGSQYNDKIVGGNLDDTLKGEKGNDIIIGGLGNDNITGGSGINKIYHSIDDGADVINLTKGEKLELYLCDIPLDEDDKPIIKYEIVKKDLVISYNNGESSVTIKNFATKDITNDATKKVPDQSYLHLYINGSDEPIDLKNDIFLDAYRTFSPSLKKYTGGWYSEEIDARNLNSFVIENDIGANINAGAGNDMIFGSVYNDTIKGGDGNDSIVAYGGDNTVDGGNGNDIYLLFKDKENIVLRENTVIKDTGKTDSTEDSAYIDSNKDDLYMWFNIDAKGKTTYAVIAEEKSTGNKASLTNVEFICTNDNYLYKFDSDELKSQIVGFLSSKGYKDVNQVMSEGRIQDQNDLVAIFNDSQNWEQIV